MPPSPKPNDYLRAYRDAAGFSLAALADAIGLSPRHLGRLERGENVGSLHVYVLASKVLGCAVDDLVPDELRFAPVPGARQEWSLPPR
jgi:transcriptional regulator with XRE-family HTH domain